MFCSLVIRIEFIMMSNDLVFTASWSAIVAVLMISSVATNVHYVTTNNTDDSNSNTLKHYLDNPKKYFTSYSQLIFFPGEYQLEVDLVFEDIRNFTMTATGSCNIRCSFNTSILVVNVTEFELQNISLANCGKNHIAFINLRQKNYTIYYHNVHHSSILLYRCALVRIVNVSISTNAYSGGLLAMNVKKRFVIESVKVQLECLGDHKFDHRIHGILFYYHDTKEKNNTNVILYNFNYKINGSCIHLSRYAIMVLLVHGKYSITITVKDTKFENLNNSGALYYHMLSCKYTTVNFVHIENSTISGNTGDSTHAMFNVKLSTLCVNSINFKNEATKQYSHLHFRNCMFVNNSNMQAMIYITPAITSTLSGHIEISNTQFIKNRNIHFIKVKGETEIVLWQLSTYIYMYSINVSLNEHHDGSNLISIANGVLYLKGNSTFMNNGYYENIFMLHLSTVIFAGYIVINNNRVKQIIEATSGSYLVMNIRYSLHITNNTVYKITKQAHTFESATRPLCPIQFLSSARHKGSYYYYDSHSDEINVHIYLLNNVLTASNGIDLTFSNCTWLAHSAFLFIDAALVYSKLFQIKHIVVNRNSTRRIPMSVCLCSNSDISCYSPNLNSIYPGQTLHVSLIVRKENLNQQNPATTLMVANTQEDDCSITESYQLSQTHLSHGCNNYSYTLWPSHKHITECKLFVGLKGIPEMFFVEIKHCPKGFILQPSKKIM